MTQTFSPIYESCLLTFGRPTWTADRPIAKSLPTNGYTNTETSLSYVHALKGIRNQEPSVVVPVTYRGQPEVLTPGHFMINNLLLLQLFHF